jgi:hypothetical protein
MSIEEKCLQYLREHPMQEIPKARLVSLAGGNPHNSYTIMLKLTYMDPCIAECDNGAILYVEEL